MHDNVRVDALIPFVHGRVELPVLGNKGARKRCERVPSLMLDVDQWWRDSRVRLVSVPSELKLQGRGLNRTLDRLHVTDTLGPLSGRNVTSHTH